MKILIFLILILLYLSTGGVLTFEVKGSTGGAVVIKCKYHYEFIDNKKYFCKGTAADPSSCIDQIKTDRKNQWVKKGRFSLYDNTTGKFFMVIFRDLTPMDTGKYYCAVYVPLFPDIYTELDLNIKEDACCMKSLEQTAYEGDTVNISCKFPQENKKAPKYFCKESWGQGCKYNLSTQRNQMWVSDDKLSLHDDREEGVLTVSISSFSTSDAGSYWCGVEMDKYHALITNVKLTFTRKDILVPTEASQTTFFSQPSSSFSSSSSSSSPSAAKSPLAPTVSSGSGHVILVSACVAVLLIILIITIIIFFICRYRRNTTQGPGPSPGIVLATVGTGAQAASDYENCPGKGFGDVTQTNIQTGPVYQSLNPNTIQQDPVYQSLNPNTIDQDPVYQSLNPNTIQQDPVYQSLNPNTIQQDPVYQTLNPNIVQQDSQ